MKKYECYKSDNGKFYDNKADCIIENITNLLHESWGLDGSFTTHKAARMIVVNSETIIEMLEELRR